jgi:hypothetical protein
MSLGQLDDPDPEGLARLYGGGQQVTCLRSQGTNPDQPPRQEAKKAGRSVRIGAGETPGSRRRRIGAVGASQPGARSTVRSVL